MIVIRVKIPGGRVAKVRLVGDRIVNISTRKPHRKAVRLPDEDIWIAHGVIEIQLNGYAGIDLNHPYFSEDDLVGVCRHLLSTWVTRFCPTLITAGYRQLARNIEEIRQACQRHSLVRSMALGFHLEGPYLNPADGPRGAHPRAHVARKNGPGSYFR